MSTEGKQRWAELPKASASYAGSTQGAAELVLYSSLGLFVIALLAGAMRSEVVGGWTQCLCWAAFGLGVIAVLACLWQVGRPRRIGTADYG
jgi:hypothetical protein